MSNAGAMWEANLQSEKISHIVRFSKKNQRQNSRVIMKEKCEDTKGAKHALDRHASRQILALRTGRTMKARGWDASMPD